MSYNFQVLAGHGDVVDIEEDDRECAVLHVDEDNVVGFSTWIIHQFDCILDVSVLAVAALFSTLHCLHQPQDCSFDYAKSRRYFHVYLILQLSIEIG